MGMDLKFRQLLVENFLFSDCAGAILNRNILILFRQYFRNLNIVIDISIKAGLGQIKFDLCDSVDRPTSTVVLFLPCCLRLEARNCPLKIRITLPHLHPFLHVAARVWTFHPRFRLIPFSSVEEKIDIPSRHEIHSVTKRHPHSTSSIALPNTLAD